MEIGQDLDIKQPVKIIRRRKMLTQNEAIMCLEAISTVVLEEKLLIDENEGNVHNLEMNAEQSRGNFMALWDMLDEEDRKQFLEKLRQFK